MIKWGRRARGQWERGITRHLAAPGHPAGRRGKGFPPTPGTPGRPRTANEQSREAGESGTGGDLVRKLHFRAIFFAPEIDCRSNSRPHGK